MSEILAYVAYITYEIRNKVLSRHTKRENSDFFVKQLIYFFPEYGERIVIRQCSTPYHDEIDVIDGQCGNSMIQPGRDVIESCHICSSDLCNSATTISAMKLLYIIVIIFLACTFHQSKYFL